MNHTPKNIYVDMIIKMACKSSCDQIEEDTLNEFKEKWFGYKKDVKAQALLWLINEEFKLRHGEQDIYKELYGDKRPPKKYIQRWVDVAYEPPGHFVGEA